MVRQVALQERAEYRKMQRSLQWTRASLTRGPVPRQAKLYRDLEMVPILPSRKSRKACMISSRVFITNGPNRFYWLGVTLTLR